MIAQGPTRWSVPLSTQTPNPQLVDALARSLLAGEQTLSAATARVVKTLGREWRWASSLVARYLIKFASRTRPRRREVSAFLLKDAGFKRAWRLYAAELRVADWLTDSSRMQPVGAAAAWPVPRVETLAELAAWLNLTDAELLWFGDLKRLGSKAGSVERLQHYRYRVLSKSFGSMRLIEAPKPRLKELQRIVLREILDAVPIHPAVHGFVPGRSIQTFTAPHVGRQVVLRMDLQDFFPSIAGVRVQALFRTLGYPEAVADLLGGICSNAAPFGVWKQASVEVDRELLREKRELYRRPHLPQGAPTSPALANLCTYRLDCRLRGLARSVGAIYTRYADDLAFSGGVEFDRCVARFLIQAAAIALEEGFSVHHRKTRVMRRGVRQHLAGIVVNERQNIRRDDYDRLKAILTNCVRLGPESQNRETHPRFREHLEGRVGFIESIHAERGRKLREILRRIAWE